MSRKNSVKKLREDIHRFIEDDDFAKAVDALREGLQATTVVRKNREDGQRGVEYAEKADHGTRLTSARLMLEYGFGKPATRAEININDDTQKSASPAEIMARLRDSGAALGQIIDVYAESAKEAQLLESTDE